MNRIQKSKKRANAVFEGGGVKGIGIAGALSVAGNLYEWDYLAGTSAGAIVASLVAAGYSPEEIRDLVFSIDYTRFEDPAVSNCIPFLSLLLSLKLKLGIYKGDYIREWMSARLKEKGIEYFGDLIARKNIRDLRMRYRLRVIASDISTGRMLILPQDIADYGIDPDYLKVADAIRMSMSIPFFFRPVTLKYKSSKGEEQISYIVDGGVLSNFPVWLFDAENQWNSNPTFGFKLVGPKTGCPNNIQGPLSMLKALFDTMMEAHDNRFIEEKNFDRTIPIPTLGVKTTDFGISKEKMNELYEAGENAAEKFFDIWDHRRYLVKHVK